MKIAIDNIFKKGDRVFHYLYKWGTVKNSNKSFASVEFDEIGWALADTDPLSFTEYTLNGFSQERPEELPKKGDIVWVRMEFPARWIVGHFFEKQDDRYHISCDNKYSHAYGYEIRTTNPYENEN